MNEQNKSKQVHEDASKSISGAAAAKPSSWKRMLSKKWVFPAVYMAAIAILVTVFFVYQGARTKDNPELSLNTINENVDAVTTENETATNPEHTETVANVEPLGWPVKNRDEVKVVMPFYDTDASAEVHKEAMVQYNDTFTPNVGIDLGREDGKTFQVTAALDGTVTQVQNHPILGNVVEITHANNVKTVYQSLADDVAVKEGDEVKKGDPIASAGRNELEKDLGAHLHFEVYQNGKVVNPEPLLQK